MQWNWPDLQLAEPTYACNNAALDTHSDTDYFQLPEAIHDWSTLTESAWFNTVQTATELQKEVNICQTIWELEQEHPYTQPSLDWNSCAFFTSLEDNETPFSSLECKKISSDDVGSLHGTNSAQE